MDKWIEEPLRWYYNEDVDGGIHTLVRKHMRTTMDDELYVSDGRILAHDILEHMNGADRIGGWEDELEAFGAILFVRYESGYAYEEWNGFEGSYPTYTKLGEGLASILYSCRRELEPTKQKRVTDSELDFAEEAILDGFRRTYASVVGKELDRGLMRHFASATRNLMRAGYKKAQKKYRDASTAGYLFRQVRDVLDTYIRNANEEDWYYSNKITLKYNLSGEVELEIEQDGFEDEEAE